MYSMSNDKNNIVCIYRLTVQIRLKKYNFYNIYFIFTQYKKNKTWLGLLIY